MRGIKHVYFLVTASSLQSQTGFVGVYSNQLDCICRLMSLPHFYWQFSRVETLTECVWDNFASRLAVRFYGHTCAPSSSIFPSDFCPHRAAVAGVGDTRDAHGAGAAEHSMRLCGPPAESMLATASAQADSFVTDITDALLLAVSVLCVSIQCPTAMRLRVRICILMQAPSC